MPVLVAFASRHGATQGIAERIAEDLRAAGLEAEAHEAGQVRDLAPYDAFVVGSALYMFHWLKDGTRFVRRNGAAFEGRPVWLFSSGPIGTDQVEGEGRDVRTTAGPKELDELTGATSARDHRVFFGAFHKGKPIGMSEQLVMRMPAARDAFPEGDFRDWDEIDAWAAGIARDLGGGAPSAPPPA